tara:strand:+ start:44 stop:943 length:900 start_codon:yes stop_codon:yes gene_type:complete
MAKFIAMNWNGDNKEGYTGLGIEHSNDSQHRRYIGDYVDGKEHGTGVYHSRDSDHIYAGQFNENKAEGIGFKSYFNGEEIYCGEYKNNKRHGIGYWKLKTGATFIGEHKNGDIDGYGTLITPKGHKFIGIVDSWLPVLNRGKWYNTGRWYNHQNQEIDITIQGYQKNGTKYTGNDKEGTCVWPNGETYKGEWRKRGEWDKAERHGVGTMIYSNGETYRGEWQNDIRHGFGEQFHKGSVYAGYYKDNMKHGVGTMTNPNGRKYVGKWIKDKKQGYGTMTRTDETTLQGEWADDKFIKARQ